MVDLDSMLAANLSVVAQQGVADNQRWSMHTQLAFQKDLFQGGQAETGVMLAGMNAADRTPVVKA